MQRCMPAGVACECKAPPSLLVPCGRTLPPPSTSGMSQPVPPSRPPHPHPHPTHPPPPPLFIVVTYTADRLKPNKKKTFKGHVTAGGHGVLFRFFPFVHYIVQCTESVLFPLFRCGWHASATCGLRADKHTCMALGTTAACPAAAAQQWPLLHMLPFVLGQVKLAGRPPYGRAPHQCPRPCPLATPSPSPVQATPARWASPGTLASS